MRIFADRRVCAGIEDNDAELRLVVITACEDYGFTDDLQVIVDDGYVSVVYETNEFSFTINGKGRNWECTELVVNYIGDVDLDEAEENVNNLNELMSRLKRIRL